MTNYIRINLATYDFTAPAPLPDNLIGLQDVSLADLSAALEPAPDGLAGFGYWPVVEADVMEPELDGEGQRYLIPLPIIPEPEPNPLAGYIPVPLFRQRLEKLGLFDDFSAYLAQYPPLMFKVLSLEAGLDPANSDILSAFDAMSVPEDVRSYLTANPSVGVPEWPSFQT